MADIGSNAVASTQAGSRILRMFIPLSRDARQWAAEGSPYAPASSITAVTISGSRSCIGPARERQDDARLRCIVVARSEEHTSELQSLMRISYAVFCLKKKK